MAPKETIALEIDSPGSPIPTEPGTVEPHSALELAAAYLDVLQKLAVAKGARLAFCGLEVRNKCVEFRFGVSDIGLAEAAAVEANRYLQGVMLPPRKLKRPIERLSKEVERQVREGRTVRASAGKWSQPLVAAEPKLHLLPTATVSFRGKVIRAGGREPGVRFETEEGDFSLDATETLAAGIAHFLYQRVDVAAKVYRTPEGRIDGGILVEFHPLSTGKADAWLEWLETAGRGWTTVPEALKELDRD
jgi:hypothetical protein